LDKPIPYIMPVLDKVVCVDDISFTQRIENIQRSAYEEGFAVGERAGFGAGEQKAAVLIERLEGIIAEITSFKKNLVDDMEPQVVNLAVAIAQKIIIEEIKTDPSVIVTIVKEALRRLQRMGTITIRLNPSIYDLFMKKKPELLEVHQDISFEVDTHVPLTGPFVISQTQEVVTDTRSLVDNIAEEINSKNQTECSYDSD